jgi:predicted nuclease of predicted toxin-antitoxin system
MKLLLDECVPRRLKFEFAGYEILTIDEAGFKGLKNGNLIRSASEIFEVLITVDKNIQHQQNKEKLSIAILILSAKSNTLQNHSHR